MALYYCKRCGRLIQNSWNDVNFRCDCCQAITSPVPVDFLDGKTNVFLRMRTLKKQFIDEYIKSSPEFDQYLFDHRDEILSQKSADLNAKLAHGKAVMEGRDKGNSYGVSCPYCKATNVREIGIVSRSISASIFGLGSKKIGKQWHCDHCGSDF